MKKNGTPDQAGGVAPRAGSVGVPVPVNAVNAAEGRTRHEVARLLLEQGPMTAAVVAEQLGISLTAIRRHLDALVADGEAETREASRREPRGRGRPARFFLLTESGRARFGHAYDDLAVSAIRFLAEHAGPDAVRAFAERRVEALVGPHRPAITGPGDPVIRAEALATALTREGYAASTRRVGTPGGLGHHVGVQLCQHHCPVAHVAAEFPQLCEAETEAFARLLGTHVQRLATIARGDNACTTHVPVTATGIPAHPEPDSTRPPDAAAETPVSDGRTARIPNGGKPA
ncbi:metalloregulator ArsR/SmtB family transcription factor [Amycolatopsis sp. PS_44_ISF1]|uniref:helix-turn-helix transcriptional regulator n=1 Tax=Amycolatopsis sp. PS_44_ISF1 TaxID=2974917 RepID=UPI0028DDD1F4|nr:metalloregulator ArsR/SmtB family transcription factor [Amycolatopsis sp. PS_44_ISF1]MDT8913938.1 transcriptional regulator [Amycolatopsis sp. PS_44_ISF1]MDT8916405.1 transcriptional regulator [Amycolatopsis sp. PS_44_ISF1]